MDRRALLVTGLLPLVLLGCGDAPRADGPAPGAPPDAHSPVPDPLRPYAFETVAVVMSGDTVERRILIADHGARERIEETTWSDAQRTQVAARTLEIRVPGTTWLIDQAARTGFAFRVPPGARVSGGGLDLSRLSLHNTFALYAERDEGEAAIAGRTCRVYAVEDPSMGYAARFHLWQELPLRAEVDGTVMTATAVDEAPAVAADAFAPPAGIAISER